VRRSVALTPLPSPGIDAHPDTFAPDFRSVAFALRYVSDPVVAAHMQVFRRTTGLFAFVANLVVMGAGPLYSYEHALPLPREFAGPDGETVATAEQVRAGKVQFQRNGLMNHGSIPRTLLFGYDAVRKRFRLRAVTPEDERAEEGVLAADCPHG
jgi:hypothetical protein